MRIKIGENVFNNNGRISNLFTNYNSTIQRDKSQFNQFENSTPFNEFSKINQNQMKERFNKTFTNGFNQSPKIYSNKVRNIFIQTPKLYSIGDIDDKKTNSRGTSHPDSFKRLSDKELNNLFGVTYKRGWNYEKNFMNKIRENTEKQQNEFKKLKFKNIFKKDTIEIEKEKNINNEKERNLTENNIISNENKLKIIKKNSNENNINKKQEEEKNNNNNNDKNIVCKTEPNIKNKNKIKNLPVLDNINNNNTIETTNINREPFLPSNTLPKNKTYQKSNSSEKIIKEQNKNYQIRMKYDRWLPKGYAQYELLVKNPELNKKQLLNNPIAYRLPNLSLKEITKKSRESDIFFTKPPDKDENKFLERALNYKDFQNSDIFLQKNDLTSILKSGEEYLFKPKKSNTYSVTQESDSKWQANTKIPTLLNHSSKEYNIVKPKLVAMDKTKENILTECNNKRNVNIVNDYNPIYRQKSLCEFIDITRVGGPNANINYRNTYSKFPDCFRKRNDICGTTDDMFNNYKNLINKPFHTGKYQD